METLILDEEREVILFGEDDEYEWILPDPTIIERLG